MTYQKKFQKTIGKSTVIWYNADSKVGIEMKTLNHLSIKVERHRSAFFTKPFIQNNFLGGVCSDSQGN